MNQTVEREVWSVTDLVRYLYQSMDQDEKLKRVWLEAEISNFIQNNKSKHMYFTLKDDYAKVKSAMFAGNNRRLRFLPKDGDRVLVRGHLSVYDREGQIQFYVQDMRLSGAGDLYVAFEQLKEKLAREGLFTRPKKTIPLLPRCVGVITSSSGAALYDILTTLKRRFSLIGILIAPVSVQGEHAPAEIVQAIDMMNIRKEVDVLIVGRGGGSIEEIWAFNEEMVAQAIGRSDIPVISAVGHETDTTISDFVADIRAATPTAAAEMVAPHHKEVSERIVNMRDRLIRAKMVMLQRHQNRLIQLLQRTVFEQPGARLLQYIQRLDDLQTQLVQAFNNNTSKYRTKIMQYQHRLELLNPSIQITAYSTKVNRLCLDCRHYAVNNMKLLRLKFVQRLLQLEALSPLNVIKRGYSLVYRVDDQKLITSQNEVSKNDLIQVRFTQGHLTCQVIELEDME